jgi:ketosteroid isomerase-like protein
MQRTKMKELPRFSFATAAVLALLMGCGSFVSTGQAMAEIENAHEQLAKAFSTCDDGAFTGAYSEDFNFFTSNTRSAIRTKAGLRAYLAASCRITPHPTASILSQTVRFLGEEAIVTGQYLFRVPAGAKIADVPQNFTALFVRQDGTWKLAVHHVSLAP